MNKSLYEISLFYRGARFLNFMQNYKLPVYKLQHTLLSYKEIFFPYSVLFGIASPKFRKSAFPLLFRVWFWSLSKLTGSTNFIFFYDNYSIDRNGRPLKSHIEDFDFFSIKDSLSSYSQFKEEPVADTYFFGLVKSLDYLSKDYEIKYSIINSYLNPSFVEKDIAVDVNHYTNFSFFYNVYYSYNNVVLRLKDSTGIGYNLGLASVLSTLKITKFNSALISNAKTYKFSKKSVLSDTLFQLQDFKHSTLFEFVWAFFPTYIIFSILVPSLYLLYSLDEEMDPYFTIKVIGHQWYWSYEYNNWIPIDEDLHKVMRVDLKYDSNIIDTDSLAFGTKRLLEVDKRMVVPCRVPLRFLVTSVMFFILEQFLL